MRTTPGPQARTLTAPFEIFSTDFPVQLGCAWWAGVLRDWMPLLQTVPSTLFHIHDEGNCDVSYKTP